MWTSLAVRLSPPALLSRHVFLLLHRYVGLAMAAFLVVAGLTGSMMAFYPELDALLNPELLVAQRPADGSPPLDPFVLRDRLLEQLPRDKAKEVRGVLLEVDPDRTANYWVDGRETFVDPYSGKIVGSREFGSIREGKKSFLTFLYELHFTLGIGDVGAFLFGCVALLWTLDCFVGAYLTFPPASRGDEQRARKPWLVRWLPAWLLKTSKLFALVFTWHRASGLWLWLMFLVFAWSAVALNLGEVYEPVMETVFGAAPDPWKQLPKLPSPREEPRLSLREAHQHARAAMATEARERGFAVHRELSLHYDPARGTYSYGVDSSLDISERLAETHLVIDGDTGKKLLFVEPIGKNTGSQISAWLIALHFGSLRIFGITYRWFVCVLGVVVAALSVTGVWIWWEKRSGRKRRAKSLSRRTTAQHEPAT